MEILYAPLLPYPILLYLLVLHWWGCQAQCITSLSLFTWFIF